MRKFIRDHPAAKDEHLTTSQLNSKFVKPETEGTSKSFIHQYADLRDETTGVPLVSTATVFVSHAWRYSFYDVVVDVMEQYAKQFPNAYFWFDLFINNQNEISTKDFDWFSQTFRNSVREIGQVLLVFSPWDDPMPIKRAWCLFEIHNALQETKVGLSIHLPEGEVQQLRAGVMKGADSIVQVLSEIQAEKAEAKTESDKNMIFDVIKNSEGGFLDVNKRVKNELRGWNTKQLKTLADQEPENHLLLGKIGGVFDAFGNLDEALAFYFNALEIQQKEDKDKAETGKDMVSTYYNNNTEFKEIARTGTAYGAVYA